MACGEPPLLVSVVKFRRWNDAATILQDVKLDITSSVSGWRVGVLGKL